MSITEVPVEVPTTDPLEEIPTLPNEPKVSETVTILRKTRDILRDRWTTGCRLNLRGQMCSIGAINYVSTGNANSREADSSDAVKVLATVAVRTSPRHQLPQLTPEEVVELLRPASVIISWNDHTPFERVIQSFDEAIDYCLKNQE